MGVCLVTGGAKRLGREICLSLSSQGHDVAIHYNHSEKSAVEVAAACRKHKVRAEIIQGDFSSRAQVEDFIFRYLKQFKETKALINNVGNYLMRSVLETSLDDWYGLFQTNLTAPFAIIKGLYPTLKSDYSSIINIGVTGLESARADGYAPVYMITKLGLKALTKSLALELAPRQIPVNMISPGLLEFGVDYEEVLPKVPMKRAGKASEITNAIEFLMNPSNRYITGQNIEVAGALWL